jgi:hypothetical protein
MRTHDPWLALALFMLVAAGALIFRATKSDTFTGQINECGVKLQGIVGDAESCAQSGARYELVLGGMVYPLSGHEPELEKLTGGKVTVVGMLDSDDVIEVSSVFRPRQF